VLFDDRRDEDRTGGEFKPPRDPRVVPFPGRRPDWLAGPGDDLGAADDPDAPRPSAALPTPVLRRPELSVPSVDMDPGVEPTCAALFARAAEPVKIAPAAESVSDPTPPVPPESGRSRRRRVSDPSAPWAPVASSVPVPKLSLVAEPEAPPRRDPSAPVVSPRAALPVAAMAAVPQLAVVPAAADTPRESAWVVALDNLRVNRAAQLGVAVAAVAVIALASWMWPRGVGTTPLSRIRRHPTEYDGREVIVRGRVGDDVFSVGAGWAFYLMQGRDTIVTFSLMRQPEPRRVITLKGQVSTGFLDGKPRQALFEGGAPLP
jgi:hypothetical protein